MNFRVFASLSSLLALPVFGQFQTPIDEQWVLSSNKEEFLENLTPSTNDYFFFHALHQQQSGQIDAFRKTIESWKQFSPSRKLPLRGIQLENRQTLLDYEAGKPGSSAQLTNILNIRKPEALQGKVNAARKAKALTPADTSEETFRRKLGIRHDQQLLNQSTNEHLEQLVHTRKKWAKPQRDFLLRKVQRADLANTVRLIEANFTDKNPLRFRQIRCAKNLSQKQLVALRKKVPSLLNDHYFVEMTILSMKRHKQHQLLRDPKQHLSWLVQLDRFTQALPPQQNSLKAHVLFHRLSLASQQDQFDLKPFVRYLALVKQSKQPLAPLRNDKGKAPQLHQDYSKFTHLRSISASSDIIQPFLDKLLVNDTNHKALSAYFEESRFKKSVVRAKLLNGESLQNIPYELSASDYEALRNLQTLSIAASTPKLWKPNEEVTLNLDLKNIENLQVSIYALDSLRYMKKTGLEIDKDLDLSSIAANTARTINTKKSAFLQHRKQLPLPELNGIGSWMVEIHGGGQRVTALIHKGEIHHSVRDTGNGQELFICDYLGAPLKDVQAEVDGKHYLTDKNGIISLPYSGFSRKAKGHLHLASANRENGITKALNFERKTATPALHLSTLSHAEQFLAGETARVAYKPIFTINQRQGDLRLIKTLNTELTGVLADGTRVQLAENDSRVSAHDFQTLEFSVPQNLQRLEVKTTAELHPIAGRNNRTLSDTKSISVPNGTNKQQLAHAYFSKVKGNWQVQVLGKNGEPWANSEVSVKLFHKNFRSAITQHLSTDDQGAVNLGKLTDIRNVEIIGRKDLANAKLDLSSGKKLLPLGATYQAGTPISCKLLQQPRLGALTYSLINKSQGNANYRKSLSIAKDGTLTLANLAEGDYELRVKGYAPHHFEVKSFKHVGSWAASEGAATEYSETQPPSIAVAKQVDGKLMVKIENRSVFSRIHLVGSQFSRSNKPQSVDLPAQPNGSQHTFGFDPCVFQNGGSLSTEHQYILNRRSQSSKLGIMLERPAWHVSPWHVEDSASKEHFASDDVAPSAEKGSLGGLRAKKSSAHRSMAHSSAQAPTAFLKHGALLAENLTPNKDGWLDMELDKLRNFNSVDIILTQDKYADSAKVDLPWSSLKTRDLRLKKTLNTTKHYTANETRAQLLSGAKAEIVNIINAKWKAYAKLSDVMSYFQSNAAGNLNNLTPLLHWQKMSESERLTFLQEHGCHEVNLFIKRRDKKWFAQYIKPQLSQKRKKSFMDHYLLDGDLSAYATPGAYQRLNTMEKALLAQRLQNKAMQGDLRSHHQHKKPTREFTSRQFVTLLNQGFDSKLDEYKPLAAHSSAEISRRLSALTLTKVHFTNLPIGQALEEFTALVHAALKQPSDTANTHPDFYFTAGSNVDSHSKIIGLQLQNVPALVALEQMAQSAGLRLQMTSSGAELMELSGVEDSEFVTRTFEVPSGFADLISGDSTGGSDDPFADSSDEGDFAARASIKDLLEASGVVMPEGATATLSNGKLIVRNSANNLGIVDELTQSLDSRRPKSKSRNSSIAFNFDSFAMEEEAPNLVENDSLPHQTKAYAESYYHKRLRSDGALSVAINSFWVDFAHWDGKTPFLSPHFADCTTSKHEALMALALLDLPFTAKTPTVQVAENTMTVTANEPMLLFYQDLREANKVDNKSNLLSSLRYFWSGEHFTHDANGNKIENAITGDFKTQALYDAQLVITNPSGIEKEIDVLRQIPQGAIRLGDNETLAATKTTIPPRGTWTHTVQFYFPSAGSYTHYAPQIHLNGESVGQLIPKQLTARDSLANATSDKWRSIVSEGSDEDVLEALRKRNLYNLNLGYLAERMENPEFYKKANDILRQRMLSDFNLAAFAIQYRDADSLRDLLDDTRISGDLFGYYTNSTFIGASPYVRHQLEDIEWRPLINQRSFKLADQNRITNQKVWDNYLTLLNRLVWKQKLDDEERLTLAYHLYLHDRNAEANLLVNSCDRENTEAKMQFDYLSCYRHFLNNDTAAAAAIANQWLDKAQQPWKKRFEDVAAQANEVKQAKLITPQNNNTPQESHWSASLSSDNTLRVDYSNVHKLSVQVYPIDLEFLFSSSPFLQKSDSSYKAIRPLQTLELKLDKEQGFSELVLPDIYQNGDRLLVIDDGDKEWLQPVQSTKIRAVTDSRKGVLQAIANDAPVSSCYVKVYAMTHDHKTIFYKDGNTDLRGMFDYLSHNIHAPNSVRKFAILVSHPELGNITTYVTR